MPILKKPTEAVVETKAPTEEKIKKSPVKEVEAVPTKKGPNPTDNNRPFVYVEKGVTKNMGDYNSAKVTVGISLPIDATEEELKKVKESIRVAHKIVDEEIANQVSELVADV